MIHDRVGFLRDDAPMVFVTRLGITGRDYSRGTLRLVEGGLDSILDVLAEC